MIRRVRSPRTLSASVYRSVGALLTNRFDIKIYREMQPDLFRTVAKKKHWVKTFDSLPTERYPFFNPPPQKSDMKISGLGLRAVLFCDCDI